MFDAAFVSSLRETMRVNETIKRQFSLAVTEKPCNIIHYPYDQFALLYYHNVVLSLVAFLRFDVGMFVNW